MNATTEKATLLGSGIYHPTARPKETVKDDKGDCWLCDKGADPSQDLSNQGCRRSGERAFTRNG